jgi:MFS family permease
MLRFLPILIINFFLSLNFGALIYINSSYLGNYFSTNLVSALFLIGALINTFFFFAVPWLLNFFGRKKLFLLFLIALLASTLGMAMGLGTFQVGASFLGLSAFLFMAYYCLDIFLEERSIDSRTGGIRGIYMTVLNAGIALGPLLLPFLAPDENLRRVYLFASLVLVIPLILATFLPNDKARSLKKVHSLPFKKWWRLRSVRAVTLARTSLEIFFTLMVIYTPIYLYEYMGFEWSELGIIFAIALLPFILLEWPAGELADRYWGEKEMMSIGFFITGAMLLIMPFLGAVFFAWMIVLFLSRVGAALIEIMVESYFFKKIDHEDTGLLSIFRLSRPAGIILGALIGALSLNLFSFEKIFFVVAIVILFGMYQALHIRDTL